MSGRATPLRVRPARSPRRQQAGAALLLAMTIVALITTVAAGMVWLQARAVQVEAAERARAQAGWILIGAFDWARLIMREDARANQRSGDNSVTLAQSRQLEESRLSTFLAVDKDNNADSGPEAFLSGAIGDAQARYNLRSLIDPSGKTLPLQVAALQRLAALAGAPDNTAAQIAGGLSRAFGPVGDDGAGGAPLRPLRLADVAWLGIDPKVLDRLAPWVDLLPVPTAVNANTAPREVLLAAIDGIDLGTAERLVQARNRKHFKSVAEIQSLLPQGVTADAARVGVGSNWFQVAGRMRLEQRVVEEHNLVQRENDKFTVRRHERVSYSAGNR